MVGIGSALPALYASTWLGLPFSIVVSAMTYAVFHFVLYRTPFGVYVFAIGGNRESLVLAGVRANLYHVALYAIGGAMAGFAALLFTARTNAGHPTAAMGLEFDAIAAVIVGGTSFERGNGWLPGTLLGVLTVGRAEERAERDGGAQRPAGREHRTAGDRRAVDRFDPRRLDPGACVNTRASRLPVAPRRVGGRRRTRLPARRRAAAQLGAGVSERRLPDCAQSAERPATGQPEFPHRVRCDAGHPHRRPRSLDRRERRPERLHRCSCVQGDRIDCGRRERRGCVRDADRPPERAHDHAPPPAAVHRHLRHAVDGARVHLLVHGRRNDLRIPARRSVPSAAATCSAFQFRST